ncbi:MAG: alkyl hydroperoxide reductase [Acidobacteria bacterium]|nr:MAG: alkyl hydroperoxide reductase [Acidobacteriota bacterium]
MPAFDSKLEEFAALDAQVLDISTDSLLSHRAWQENDIGTMHLPMCADFYPHGEVTKQFGILREGPPVPGICERAVFVVDKGGKIVFSKTYPLDQLPNLDEVLKTLREINS